MKKLLFVLLAFVSTMAMSQTAPAVYYRFDESNALAPTVGATNLSGGGTYTVTTGGQVGKYLSWKSNAGALLQGQNVTAGSDGTVQLLFRKNYWMDQGRNNRLLAWGDMTVNIEWPNIFYSVGSTTATITLDGINRKSWGYLFDGNWHHLAFVYTGSVMQMWLDGRKLHEQAATGATLNGNIFLSSNVNYAKVRSDVDEIAVYTVPLTGNQIQQNYVDAMAGNAYTTANAVSVPALETVVGTLDTNEFTTGSREAWTQLQNYPLARYKPGNTLIKNFNWQDPKYQGGLFQSRFTNSQTVPNSLAVQTELANNWNYHFNVNFGTDAWANAWVNAANLNPQWKLGIITFRAQLNGNTPELVSQSKPANQYLQNSGGTFLDINGNATSQKIWRPTAPVNSYAGDGNNVKAQFADLFTRLNRDIDIVSENGEIFPHISNSALAADPVVNADRIASGLTPEAYLARRVTENDNGSFRDIFMTHPRLANAKYLYYATDGYPQFRLNYAEARKLSNTINGQYYSTPDVYIRYPYNWRYFVSAWHGWQWIAECRYRELAVNDKLYSPYVSAGWDATESNNVRPAQYLGMLKVLSATGAEFFYSGFFSLSAPWPDSKNWIWQAASSSYAQAVASRYEDFLRNGYLMDGDTPNSWVDLDNSVSTPGYAYYSGDIRKLVVVRKHNTLNKYVITGTFQNNSNLGGTEKTGLATIKLAGDSLIFPVRRQGSVYVYDKTVSPAVWYQLDAWHDTTHYDRWTRDFDMEAEVYDNNASGVAIKTFAAWPNLSTFRSYLTFTGTNQVQYTVQPRSSATYYAYVMARSLTLGDSTGFTLQMDNGTIKTVSCITDSTWRWYRYNTSDSASISYADLSAASHVLKLTSLNNKLLVDRIILSTNASLHASIVTACGGGVAPPTPPTAVITPSGATNFCQGGSVTLTANSATSYLWSTGATTQAINATATGNYIVTITTSSGSDASDPVTVNVTPNPVATITVGGATTLCTGQSVTLTANSANSYLWSTGATTQSISAGATGSYTVSVTTSGCSSVSAPVSVSVTPCTGITPPAAVTASSKRWYSSTLTWTHAANDATEFQLELIHVASNSTTKHTVGGAIRTKTYQWLRYRADYRFRIRAAKNGVYSNWVEVTFKTN